MKPILFNTEMVKAILDGRKTTTRRPVKNLAISDNGNGYFTAKEIHKGEITEYLDEVFGGPYNFVVANAVKYAPYQKGDILYVRETWKIDSLLRDKPDYPMAIDFKALQSGYSQAEIMCSFTPERFQKFQKFYQKPGWQSPYFMPKEAARIFLRVTDAKAERLQNITEDGAKAEGLISTAKLTSDGLDYTGLTAYDQFGDLWDSTVKKSDLPLYGWDANPWLWVISFKRCEKPGDNK